MKLKRAITENFIYQKFLMHLKNFLVPSPYYRDYRKKQLFLESVKDKSYDYNSLKFHVINFINSLYLGGVQYQYSTSTKFSTLYSVSAAYLIKYLLNYEINEKDTLVNYILPLQTEEGLFRDNEINNKDFERTDHVGWRHILPIMLPIFEMTNIYPRHDFNFVYQTFEKITPEQWLASLEWGSDNAMASNRIMNIGTLLQYSRDYFQNTNAVGIINRLQHWLINNKIDQHTGLWGDFDGFNNKDTLHIGVNTTYHILTFLKYDNVEVPFIKNTIKSVIANQNKYGGFGTSMFPNACDDIDSIYILAKYKKADPEMEEAINLALRKGLKWILANQNNDGGFVFQRFTKFAYGGYDKLSAEYNESDIFFTWFRILSIAYIAKALNLNNDFKLSRVPGYQY